MPKTDYIIWLITLSVIPLSSMKEASFRKRNLLKLPKTDSIIRLIKLSVLLLSCITFFLQSSVEWWSVRSVQFPRRTWPSKSDRVCRFFQKEQGKLNWNSSYLIFVLVLWAQLHGITLGQTITDPINQMITITKYIAYTKYFI